MVGDILNHLFLTEMPVIMVKISWNVQKIPGTVYVPILLCRATFLEIKKFLAKFPEIKKFLAKFPEIKKFLAKFPEIKKFLAKFPEIKTFLAKFPEIKTFLAKFPEIKSFLAKFPEIRKFSENWHLCYIKNIPSSPSSRPHGAMTISPVQRWPSHFLW